MTNDELIARLETELAIALGEGQIQAYHALLRHGMKELQAGREYPQFVLDAAAILEQNFTAIAALKAKEADND